MLTLVPYKRTACIRRSSLALRADCSACFRAWTSVSLGWNVRFAIFPVYHVTFVH